MTESTRLPAWVAPAADLAVLLVFVAIGRRTHGEDPGASGFLRVLWPFAAGLAVAYAASGIGRAPLAWRRASAAWVVTVAVGEALRLGVQDRPWKPAFLVVATLFVGVGMLGWRAAVSAVARRRATR